MFSPAFFQMSFGSGMAISVGMLCALMVFIKLCEVMIEIIVSVPDSIEDK